MPDQVIPADDTGIQKAIATGAAAALPTANGLSGVYLQVGNMTAIGVMLVVFVVNNNRQYEASKADRTMFQSELKYQRDQTDAHTERTLSKLEAFGVRMDALSQAIQAAAAASRLIKSATPPDGSGHDCHPVKPPQ